MKCPKCSTECHRDEVDVGVGVIYGPWGCPECAWSEYSEYDLSEGQSPLTESGYTKDQFGGLTPSRSDKPRRHSQTRLANGAIVRT